MEERLYKTVTVLNFGCSANRAIAEGISGTLKQSGYKISTTDIDADFIIINTCVVKQNTEHRMKDLLLSLPDSQNVIITGCLPVVMQKWIEQHVPSARILYPENANEIVSLIENRPVNSNFRLDSQIWEQLYLHKRVLFNPLITTVEISRGCLGNCSYCIVKHAKGHLRSRNPFSIIHEVKDSIKAGSKEIWLTAQDTGTYGWDRDPKTTLPDLISELVSLQSHFYIRIGMMTPYTMEKIKHSLIKQMNNSKVFSFLHLPIQSGSNTILTKMRRKETREGFIELVQELKSKIPRFVLSTDIIVGFPGETEEDFKLSESLINQIKPTIVNISKYTDRPGTTAAKLKSKIPTKIKSQRSKRLMQLSQEISKGELQSWIGWTGSVIIDDQGTKKNQLKGRNTSYLPVIINNLQEGLGTFQTLTITDATVNYLIGTINE
ncbi:MAG: tRNA (N(6)-L-threonylcarbamoyladenosine(37)-C(2))-methylthiotransferase [Candidatus Hodarchaeales archaeon]|jgi:MiaB-like tRNA modifying enzyme